nr:MULTISPECIES: LacI family DNA-binding transcriptional regulator [unclassified Ruegeria]
MSVRVTMRDIAKEAGVSPMTVSRALKSDGSVNAKTRQMVQDVADKLGYVYDTTAQAFRAQRSGFLALTLPSINNANFATTHKALTESLAETDLQLLQGITNYDVVREEQMVRQLLARRPDAMILTGGTHTDTTRRLLESASIPVFEIWDIPEAPIGHVIGFSNSDAMGLIVDHLAQSGRQRLGFVGASADTDARGHERRLGTIKAARERGLAEVLDLQIGPAPATMSSGLELVMREIDRIRGLDALVCVSDPVAFGAMMALECLGLTIPGDIAVTGFGNFEISRISRPSITTLDVGAQEIGTLTGRCANEILSGISAQDAVIETLTPRLLVRKTTG